MLYVYTEQGLEKALKRNEQQFVLKGQNAEKILEKLEKAEREKTNMRNASIGFGLLCLIAAPFTAGTSLIGVSAAVGSVALSEAVILAIISAVVTISVEAIRALKEYNIKKLDKESIEFTHK